MSPPLRIAVIGGGPSGLAAAHRLARPGIAVVVFEAAAEPGGRTRTDTADGFRIDAGTQLFGSGYATFLRLLEEAGGAPLLERSPGRDALWRGGRAHEVTYGSPASMLTSGALPFSLKMRLGARYLPFLTRHADALDLHHLERAAALDRESAAAWGAREMGSEFVDLMVAPLLASLYGSLPEETSAGFYHALALQGVSLAVLALRGGAGGFCAALARALAERGVEIRTDAPVRAVLDETDAVEVSGDGWSDRFDAAVLALPAPAARRVARNLAPAAAEWLREVRVSPTVSLALLLDRPAGVRYFGLSFARGEARALAAACVQETKVAGLVPPGKGLVVAFPTPAAGERLVDAPADQALALLLPELHRPFPRLESALLSSRLYRWPHGRTLFHPGYLGHLGRFAEGAVEGDGRIALAGDYLAAPTVEGAVVAGGRAAERLLRRIGASPAPRRS